MKSRSLGRARARRRALWLVGLLAVAALSALPGASLRTGSASAVPVPVVMTDVCVSDSKQGQMSFPVGGTCPAGYTSFAVDDPGQILETCYLASNGAIRKVSSPSDCANAPRSKKELFLEVPSLTTDLYFCADNSGGGLFFEGTSPVKCSPKQFLVVVEQANQPPIADPQSVSLNEDATLLVTLTGSDPDAQPITFKITSLPTQGELFKGNSTAPADEITSVPTALSSADVTYKPATDYFGPDSFQFKTNDGFTDSAAATVSIDVVGVNDAPSFTKGADQTFPEDSGPNTIAGWATGISAGPANESGQAVTFVITGNSNPGLFSTAPAVSPTGALSFTPAANTSGAATIDLKLTDDGGAANGGVDESATQSFTITISAVNDAPSFTKGADESVLEDSGPQTVVGWATGISAGPANESGQTVTFEITNNTNASLFSVAPAVSTAGDLTYTPAADAFGSATITLRAKDDGGTANGGVDVSATQSFEIVVGAVNDAPSFTKGADQTVDEDSGPHTIPGWATGISAGPANESGQTVSFVVTNNTDPGLFSAGPSVSSAGTLSFTPAADAYGSATIELKATDDGGTADGGVDESPTQSFTITIDPVNDPPSFDLPASPDQAVLEDSGVAGAHTVPGFATSISKGPANESGQTLTFDVTNGNNGLFSVQPDIDEATGDLTYTLAPDANGSATVSVSLSDDGGTANGGSDTSGVQTFEIDVAPVNDEPSFDLPASPDQTVVQDSGPQTVAGFATNISAGPADESGQTLTFHVSNDNNPLFATQPALDETSGDLTFESASGATGSALVSVFLTDDGGTADGGDDTSATQTFTITITPPNATPVAQSQTGANAVSATEDTTEQITLTATDADGDALTFSIVGSPTKGALGNFGVVSCVGSPSTCTQTVDYTPFLDENGADSFTFEANDGTIDSNVATVEIDIAPVNDAPSFTKGADESVLEDSGSRTVNGWATGISAGPSNESGQTVTFEITNNTNAGLFSVAPAVSPGGDLTYTPAPDAFGSATITLRAVDDGGTANGGVDVSATQSLEIVVGALNDAPSFTKGANQTFDEDSGAHTIAGWATGISAGPANESGQTVSFVVTNNSNPGLFSAGPAVSSTGTLSFTSAANQHGSATIELKATDDGGTANGGVDESPTQTFTITINAVNDAPTSPGRAYGAGSLQANMRRSIDAGSGLLVGAADASDVAGNAGYTPSFTVGTVDGVAPVAGTITTTVAGVGTVVANAATGAFTIDPAPGVTGNVAFSFTVCDSGDGSPASQCSAPASASFDIAGPVIWFVNPAAVTNGSGTLASPFNVLASADAVDAANHRVFVYTGSTTTGLALNSGEWLVGQGATGTTFDALMAIAPPAGTIARPSIGGTRPTIGGGVALNTNAVVRGLDIAPGSGVAALTDSGGHAGVAVSEVAVTGTNAPAADLNATGGSVTLSSASSSGSATSGIALTNVTASFSAAAGSITNATGADVAISGGNGSFTYNGSITDDLGTLVSIASATGGSKSFGGAISDGGDGDGSGISLTNNTGATIVFTGGLQLATGANPAFAATGGGTVNVTGTNTIVTTTGTALNVANTTIGASGLTFRSISSNGAANGIVLNTTGATGGLTVQGNSAGTCGTAATEADCTGGTIQSSTGDGIVLEATTSPSFTRMNVKSNLGSGIRATGVSGLSVSNSLIQNNANAGGQTEAGLFLTDVTGTTTLASSTVKGSFENNVQWNASSGSGTVSVTSSTIGPTGATGATGNSGIQMIGTGTGVATLSVSGSTFASNNASGIGTSFADSSAHTVNVSTSTFTDNNISVAIGVTEDADGTFDVNDNTMLRSETNAVQVLAGATSTADSHLVGRIRNNDIGDSAVDSGARDLIGIAVELNDDADGVIDITNNIIRHTDQEGIFIQARDPNTGDANAANATLDLHVLNNTISSIDDNTAFPFGFVYGMRIESRHVTDVCLDISGNSSASVGAAEQIRVRQRDTSVYRLERFVGNGAVDTDVEAFLIGQNPALATADATHATSYTGVANGTCRDVP